MTDLIIINGKLGSGKTTLLNSVMTKFDKKTAYIINEYAVLGIDQQEFQENRYESLNNGCVCCSKSDDLIQSINKLVKEDYERIILETTGLASLESLLDVIKTTKAKITNIIMVIDAYAFSKTKGFSKETLNQAKKATTIVINKTDLVEDHIISKIKKNLQEKNIVLTRGILKKEVLLEKFDINYEKKEKTKFQEFLIYLFPELKIDKISRHVQKEGITSISFTTKNEVKKEQMERFLTSIQRNIIRAKGYIKSDDKVYKFNYAAGLFYFEESTKKINESQIVLIGKINLYNKLKYIKNIGKIANSSRRELYNNTKLLLS